MSMPFLGPEMRRKLRAEPCQAGFGVGVEGQAQASGAWRGGDGQRQS